MKSEIKKKIENELCKLNYKEKYLGTKYLIDTILIVYYYGNTKMKSLRKKVYPYIAKKYNTSSSNVKCNITRSTNEMYYDCEEGILRDYLEDDFDYCKPRVREIIRAVIKHIERN